MKKTQAARNSTQTHRSARLDVELANRRPVIHSIERGDFVYTCGGHLEDSRYLVHDRYRCEAVLALAQVEQRHYGSLLVLGRVAL